MPTSGSRSRTPKVRSAIQPSVCRSRRPPGPSLMLGSRLSEVSPKRAWRMRSSSRLATKKSRGGHTRAAPMASISRASSTGSPTIRRSSISAVSTVWSAAAAAVHWAAERTLWLIGNPASHNMAKKRATASWWRCWVSAEASTSTSTSDWGNSSPRPYPPTANSAIGASAGMHRSQASFSRWSTARARSARMRSMPSSWSKRLSSRASVWASEARAAAAQAGSSATSGPMSGSRVACPFAAGGLLTGRCRRPARGSGSRRRPRSPPRCAPTARTACGPW